MISVVQGASSGIDLTGDWRGSISAGAVPLRLVFHFKRGGDGGWVGTLDSPDQGAKGMPIGSVALAEGKLILTFPDIRARYEGSLASDGLAFEGTWAQGPAVFPLKLAKSAAPVPEARRPQLPRAPFPYATMDVKFPSLAKDVKLAGTLCIPRGKGPFPAVVLVSGSGPQDRDETLFGHKPFQVIADHLARNGIASLRYDDRGVGGSTGNSVTATTLDFAQDTEGALRVLRTIGQIRRDAIGIIGHSEGGLIGPLVAARSTEVGFLILLAGPGMPGRTVILEQVEALQRAMGVPAGESARAVALQRKLVDVACSDGDPTDIQRRLLEVADGFAATLSGAEKAEFEKGRPMFQAQLATLATPWFRTFLTHDPRPVLARLRVPVLALHGGKDLQVVPTTQAPAIRAALEAGGNRRAKVEILPGLNHLFQTCRTGLPAEYGEIEETFSPVALKRMVAFVREVVAAKPSGAPALPPRPSR
ncbi:MAG: alpha/beta hydrolase family protein [Armatimonadota bacterium]